MDGFNIKSFRREAKKKSKKNKYIQDGKTSIRVIQEQIQKRSEEISKREEY